MERASPYDEESDQHQDKPKITMDSINDTILPKADKNVEGIQWVEQFRENDYKLEEKWREASEKPDPFPPFDDGYDESFYYNDEDANQLGKLTEVNRSFELLDREERRNDLKETYNAYKAEHDEKFKSSSAQTSKKVTKRKALLSDSSSSPDSDSESLTETSASESSSSDSESTVPDTDSESISSSDSDEDRSKKQKSEKSLDEGERQITMKEMNELTIKGSHIRYFTDEEWRKTVSPITFFFIVLRDDNDQVTLGKINPSKNRSDPLHYINLFDSESKDVPLENILDDPITTQLYDHILKDEILSTDRRIKLLANKIKRLKQPPKAQIDPNTVKRYNLAMNNKIPASSVLFEIRNQIKTLEANIPNEEVNDDSSDYEDRDSENVKQLRHARDTYLGFIRDLEENERRKEEEKLQQQEQQRQARQTHENPEKTLMNQLSQRMKKMQSSQSTQLEEPQQLNQTEQKELLKEMFSDESSSDSSSSSSSDE